MAYPPMNSRFGALNDLMEGHALNDMLNILVAAGSVTSTRLEQNWNAYPSIKVAFGRLTETRFVHPWKHWIGIVWKLGDENTLMPEYWNAMGGSSVNMGMSTVSSESQ